MPFVFVDQESDPSTSAQRSWPTFFLHATDTDVAAGLGLSDFFWSEGLSDFFPWLKRIIVFERQRLLKSNSYD